MGGIQVDVNINVNALLDNLLQAPNLPPALPQAPANVEGDVGARLDAFRLPAGAADVSAFQDFTKYVLGTEHAYAAALDPQPSPCLPIARQAFQNRYRTIQASARRAGLPHDALVDLDNLNAQAPARQLEAMRCLLSHGSALVRDDDEIVDSAALREIGESLDGLVDIRGYRFDIFQPRTLNVGVRLVYRQEWTPLRYQCGELLYTIPLAPGERVQYETKSWQSSKTVEEVNDSATYSTEEVLSTTRRDISEVMNASTHRFGGKVEASGSVNLGVVQLGGGAAGFDEHQRESRRSKQTFQEYMRKSSESMRNERKVAVSVTREQGSETRVTREISNPNNEITVSYLFYELQRVYRVRQWLHHVVPVVYVAMDVPPAMAITEQWIVEHDYLLAGAALDKSFIEPITFVVRELPGLRENWEYAGQVYAQAKGTVQSIQDAIVAVDEDIANSTGFADIFARIQLKTLNERLKTATDALRQAQEDLRVARTPYRQGMRALGRLIAHVRANILHYMQAIWDSEVPEQRYLRLRSVPYPDVRRQANGVLQFQGWLPLADVIDTARPMGYVGNYAAFELCRDDNGIVLDLAEHYLADDGQPADPDNEDPDQAAIEIVTPADAIHVEALPGTHALLEPFKLQHRALDVARARQETIAQALENARRLMLLNDERYGDPKVEKLVLAESGLVEQLAGALEDPE